VLFHVITNTCVSFPLFCRTSPYERNEEWGIRGSFGIEIHAWPRSHLRALNVSRSINKIDRTQIKTVKYGRPSSFASLRVTASLIRVRIIVNLLASRCRCVAHSRLLFRRLARSNTRIQEAACARSCNSVAILSREGSVTWSNVYEKSCNRRVIEQLQLNMIFCFVLCVSLFSLGFHLFSQENSNLMASIVMMLALIVN
jgi:hypothetical protein